MLNDVFVLDAICHAYNFATENRVGQPYADGISKGVYDMHLAFSPPNRPDLLHDLHTFNTQICDPEITGQVVFGESWGDAIIYHELPLYGYFKDGGSPLWVGEKMRERWPGRVFLYGGVSPHQPGALDRVDELVEKHKVSGIKLYPHDMVAGELKSFRIDDVELLFPIFEKVRKYGLKTVAIHKAIVMGPVPIEPYYPLEVGAAARAFRTSTSRSSMEAGRLWRRRLRSCSGIRISRSAPKARPGCCSSRRAGLPKSLAR